MYVKEQESQAGTGGYAEAASLYRAAGWEGVLPLPAGRKENPPTGFTGTGGAWPTTSQINAWRIAHADGNVALRLPPDVVGIDVDVYHGGDVTLAELEERWGPLPPTWVTTSRDDGSGIRLYRVPAGTRLRGTAGPGIDVLQHHHRYAVVWPSVHPSGAQYRWEWDHEDSLASDPYGYAEAPPAPTDLPDLPAAWLEGLAGRDADAKAAGVDLRAMLAGMAHGAPCPAVTAAYELWSGELAGSGGRHDAMTRGVLALLRLGDEGHVGAIAVLRDLHDDFMVAVTFDGSRDQGQAAVEYRRALTGAAAIVAADPALRDGDPCDETPGERETRQIADLFGISVEEVYAGLSAQAPPARREGGGRRLVDPPGAPMRNARAYLEEHHDHPEHRTLISQGSVFHAWDGRVWPEVEDASLRAGLYAWLEEADYLKAVKAKGETEFEQVPFNPTRAKVGDVVDALHASTHVPVTVNAPVWLDSGQRADALVTATGVLDLTTRVQQPHTPRLYVHAAVPYPYDPKARAPSWDAFLRALWPDDAESVATLQEWFGYVLSGDTAQQKGLFLIGPPRAGKGTIARVLTALIGPEHVAGPTLAALGGQFGLAQLVGKPLAIIADARLRKADDVVTERLLAVTGEDVQTVDRKHREPLAHVTLPTRIMMLSNEVPRFADASGALASRFVVMVLGRSWLGKEDVGLSAKLAGEMPGILNWALEGLSRLRARGRFVQPASADEVIAELEELSSPVLAFLRECCEVGDGLEVPAAELYAAWEEWCEDNGRLSGSVQSFGRDVRAAVPGLRDSRPRSGGVQRRVYHGLRVRHSLQMVDTG